MKLRRDSQRNYSEKHHTTIVVDWDDTIFPTSWLRVDLGLNWRFPLAMQLQPSPRRDEVEAMLAKLSARVEAFVRSAHELGNVFIVTLAREHWVEVSSKNFMPNVLRLLQELDIKVVYARDYITEAMKVDKISTAMGSIAEERTFCTRAKANAMVSELVQYYDRQDVSWKNLISIGDSDAERDALITACQEYLAKEEGVRVVSAGLTGEIITKDGYRKRVRSKTVKMLEDPSCEDLVAELRLLALWLPHLVSRDAGLDITLPNSDDDAALTELNAEVTGNGMQMSWTTCLNDEPRREVSI